MSIFIFLGVILKSIMIVEDTPTLLNLVVTVLQMAKYHTIQAPSGEEALEVLKETSKVDILVTDILMPGIDGFELARQVRESITEIPIVFISGYFDSTKKEYLEWVEDPRVSFLLKPFNPADLINEIENMLQS